MFPWLRLIRVGVGVIAQAKVDVLATTRVGLPKTNWWRSF
jgi:hypothetical protein